MLTDSDEDTFGYGECVEEADHAPWKREFSDSRAGVPIPQTTEWYWSMAYSEPGHTAGGDMQKQMEGGVQVLANSSKRDTSERSSSWPLEMLLHRLKDMEIKQNDKIANILDVVGEFGTFQRRLLALTFLPSILLALFTFVDIFMFTAQRPYCNTSWILSVGPNLSEEEQMNLTLPREPNGSFQTCLMYLPVPWDLDSIIRFGLNDTQPCQDGWIYPESKKRSLINEFDLVCGKKLFKETVQTTFLVGLLIGSPMCGFLSDKLGRYPSILLSLLQLIVFGFGTAFISSFHQYLLFRFGMSQALVGYSISSASLVTEWLVGEHRAHAVVLAHCSMAVGITFLMGLAYSLPHWRLLFLIGGAPAFSLISYIWILPESPRWLMVKGKVQAAKQVLCSAAGVNHRTIPSSLLDKLQLLGKKVTHASVLDFYNNRQLCKVTLVMGFMWFTLGCSYFTLSFRLKDFGINIYFRQVIFVTLEIPTQLCCIFLLEQIGRKWSLAVTLFQGSFMSMLILTFPPATELKSTVVLLALLGKCSLKASVTVFFIYAAELFPTVLRATGLGLVCLAWMAGAILSVTLISQRLTLLSNVLSCISAILALSLCFLLPETHDQPISDSLENYPLQTRSMSKNLTTRGTLCDDMTEEVAMNTILNALNLDSDFLFNMCLQSKEETSDSLDD